VPDKAAPLVLVVDDARDMRDLYSLYLIHIGMRAQTATTVAEAVRKAIDYRPDVIVMDVFLAGGTGDEAAARLKVDERTRDIPLICLSGTILQEHQAAFARQCDALLLKPCMPEDVAKEVQRVLAALYSAS